MGHVPLQGIVFGLVCEGLYNKKEMLSTPSVKYSFTGAALGIGRAKDGDPVGNPE
jgi:hypothetical protein